MNRERLLKLVADVCLTKDGRERVAVLDSLLDAHGVVGPDREVLMASGARLGVYRALVRNNIASVVFRILPRTRALVNAHANDAFDDTLVAFLHDPCPRSPLLRDVAGELAAFAREAWAKDDAMMPSWALDLLAYESALFESDAAPPDADMAITDARVSLETRLGPSGSARVLDLAFAVHELAPMPDVSDEVALGELAPPAARATSLLISRDPEGRVFTTELDPLARAVIGALVEGATLGESVTRAAFALDLALSSDRLVSVAAVLSTVTARGAFVITRP